eukprot:CAMPEP_0181238170 /NCGR_PEP_ID=MMETSP1096-20121128/39191_1 /TAXON_ID=156174 ORGANISM="Chrysochromulina ericina, Strain CCMP281" /NCGR_SAMPLE_ID=MMETSP1096 /ASSEMBLY_ACC=CAM_ASM_000453 /LENGTH=55 /DNA_ID=CAMNT_0023333649 /DNA_START=366 /DNA_END=533 /DNA_ORIENTATION=-
MSTVLESEADGDESPYTTKPAHCITDQRPSLTIESIAARSAAATSPTLPLDNSAL